MARLCARSRSPPSRCSWCARDSIRGINQGIPSTLGALWDVIGRRQYDVAGLWPRQAPLWVQVANWFEYADWQVALASPMASRRRGRARRSRSSSRCSGSRAAVRTGDCIGRRWRALCGAVRLRHARGSSCISTSRPARRSGGACCPDSAPHEARDRDYFFVLGFWVWGVWAGIGAVALAERLRARWAPIGALAAALPLVLNAPAVDRRAEPERSIARRHGDRVARICARERGALRRRRQRHVPRLVPRRQWRECAPTSPSSSLPLLGAEWYRAQLARRASLVTQGEIARTRSASHDDRRHRKRRRARTGARSLRRS